VHFSFKICHLVDFSDVFNCVQGYKMMNISMDFTFIDAPTHSTDETLSKFQARISEFSGTTDF